MNINLQSDLSTLTFEQLLSALRINESKIQKYAHLYIKEMSSYWTGGTYQLSARLITWRRLWEKLNDQLVEKHSSEFYKANADAGLAKTYEFCDLLA